MDDKAPWPALGDKLFDPQGKTRLEFKWLPLLGIQRQYIEGFKGAADTVVEQLEHGEQYPRDQMFLAVAHLYRHWLELHIKYVFFLGRKLDYAKSEQGELSGHFLDRLWRRTRRLLEETWPKGDRATLDGVESVVMEFCEVDPDGQDFRYAKRTNGQPSLQKIPAEFSVSEFKNAMDRLYAFFDSVSLELEAEWDSRNAYEYV